MSKPDYFVMTIQGPGLVSTIDQVEPLADELRESYPSVKVCYLQYGHKSRGQFDKVPKELLGLLLDSMGEHNLVVCVNSKENGEGKESFDRGVRATVSRMQREGNLSDKLVPLRTFRSEQRFF